MVNNPTSPTSSSKRSFLRWRPDQQWEAYLFLLPSLLGFVLFVLLPVLASLGLSFVKWNMINPMSSPKFVGLANFRQLLGSDQVFDDVVWNTAYFMITIVPLQLILGLLVALALNQSIRGALLYRVIYFMPVVTIIVAGAIVFQFMLNRNFGLISNLFWSLGEWTGLPIQPPDFLGSTKWSKPSVVMLTIWKNVGFTMVIYLAALQGVPQELYDAANADGATTWQRFRHVTMPLISPTTFFLFVIQMIGAFQLFTEAFVMTAGGPANSTLTVVYYIYQNAFEYMKMGKASAIAWFLFLFIFLFTLLQTRLQSRWVHYEAGE